MAITSFDDYIASKKQIINMSRVSNTVASYVSVAYTFTNHFHNNASASFNGCGYVLASSILSNTPNGLVKIGGDVGYPKLKTFTSGATGYITKVSFQSKAAFSTTVLLQDEIFNVGPFTYNTNNNLTTPSWASRVPTTDYAGTELWIEANAGSTGNPSFSITYLDGAGVSRNTTFVMTSTLALLRTIKIPLNSLGVGISAITNVTSTVATAGTFNVHVVRTLWTGKTTNVAGDGISHGLDETGMPIVLQNTALRLIGGYAGTTGGDVHMFVEVANK